MKYFYYLLSVFFSLTVLTGCASIQSPEESSKLKVVSTIFPSYDFIRQIAGEEVELTMLLAPGVESHSYEPSPKDIITISQSDLFIYAGGDSDTWVEDILSSIDTSEMTIVSLIDCVEPLESNHEHSVDEDIISSRSLEEWAGTWKPVLPYVEDGSLDKYMETIASENNQTVEEVTTYYLNKYATEIKELSMNGNTVTIKTQDGMQTATYLSAGYEIVDSENGQQVWFLYEIEETSSFMPTRLAINDHSTGHHHEHGDEVAHFHLNYGEESFEELISQNEWSPSFYESDANAEQILDVFMGHEEEFDEHVWTSPKRVYQVVEKLRDLMIELDPTHQEIYETNAANYLVALADLDATLEDIVNTSKIKTLVFGDRFPFRYLANDYGLTYKAAFSGCSTDTEVSAAMIAELIDEVNEHQIPVVFSIELSTGNIAKTIAQATGAKHLTLHSAHNISKSDFESGMTYFDIMMENIEVLKEALN